MTTPWEKAAIAGIGQTEFSQKSGRSELRLASEAILAALDDAGLTADGVDGLCTFDLDSNDPATVAVTLGLPAVTHFWASGYGGGGGCATIMSAAMAVITGAADVVVAYRAMNERSGRRYGQARAGSAVPPRAAFATPYGIHTAAQGFALNAARYMHDFGVTNADLAPVAVANRRHAANNPAARFYGRPITTADHQASRWIVEPVLRLLDCCLESDGAVAIVVTSTERARDLAHPPVPITAAAQGLTTPVMRNYYVPDITEAAETGVAARKLWAAAGLTPADVQTAVLYDHFTPLVLTQLEALGFCPRGEAKDFVADGAIEIGGRLPVNTHGGLMGEAYIHGMNGIAEAVRQIRGTAINQVAGVEHVLVTSGPGVPTSALIVGRA